MSLVREALRMSVVRALRGRTWAGERVLDSESGPVDDIAFNAPSPVILVFTDDGERSADRAFTADDLAGQREQNLLIEVLITQRMALPMIDPDTGQIVLDPATGRPAVLRDEDGNPVFQMLPISTDRAMEWRVGAIQRQIMIALADPDNAWAVTAKRLMGAGFKTIKDQRGTSDRDGSRFAGRQMTLTVQMLAEPAIGAEPKGVWIDFLEDLAAEGPESAAIADEFRNLILGKTTGWSPGDHTRAAFGYTGGVAEALGYEDAAAGLPPVLDNVAP